MRQAGVIAGAALYALENHVDRLTEDHRHAQMLGEAISRIDGLSLQRECVETNIVIFDVADHLGTASQLASRLEDQGVSVLAMTPRMIRAVTHLGITEKDIHQVVNALQEVSTEIARI